MNIGTAFLYLDDTICLPMGYQRWDYNVAGVSGIHYYNNYQVDKDAYFKMMMVGLSELFNGETLRIEWMNVLNMDGVAIGLK